MALPVTFVAGDVLQASQLNSNFTYLEGVGGLQLIKTQVIGSAVASVEVTGAFSATYDNYLITVSGGGSSTQASMRMKLGATTAGYFCSFANAPYNQSGVSSVGTNNGAIWDAIGNTAANGTYIVMTLLAPQLAKLTYMSSAFVNLSGLAGTGTGQCNGFLNNTTQYTAFTILPGSGTLTGGTIRVYGYANS